MTFTVNSADDQGDADPGDGDCDTEDPVGECTLRAAVDEANATPGEQVTILLPADTYLLDSDTQIVVQSDPTSISIQGDGADTTIIDGNGTTRIFQVNADAELSIEGVTLTNGSASTDGGAVDNQGTLTVIDAVLRDSTTDVNGGALNNTGTATLSGVTFLGNSAPSGSADGGAVYNFGGTMTITGSLFEGNVAEEDAGAIENDGELEISDTTFRGNEATTNDGGAIDNDFDASVSMLSISSSLFEDNVAGDQGGALDQSSSGDVSISSTEFRANTAGRHGGAIDTEDNLAIDSSTFTGNTSGSDVGDSGGAIHNDGGAAELTVRDSTFRGNTAPGDDSYGGAIENAGGDVELWASTLVGNEAHEGGGFSNTAGFAHLTNVTISGNVADEGGGIYTGLSGSSIRLAHVTIARNTAETAGGGINSTASNVNLQHTLVAENAPANCAGETYFSIRHNVYDDDSCPADGDGDQVVDDALITDLGDYGGDTQVHALIAGSPAIDASEPAGAEEDEQCFDASFEGLLEQDQRGAPRPVDGDDSGVAFCDAGAFEFVPPDSLILTPGDATNETDTDHTVTAAVTDTLDAPSESITVRFSVSGANSTSGSGVTDADGDATFAYTGSNAGDDTITAYADTDGDGTHDDGEPSDTATKTWVAPEEPDQTSRLWGDDRFLTAIEISQDSYPDGGAGAVVLARDDVFADALSGTPFAVQEDAPLLLTQTSALRPEVAEEIQRVLPDGSTVYLLGGEQALSQDVAVQVGDLGYQVERVEGFDRFETAVEIAGELGDPDTLMVATGFDFVDAFTAGPAAIAADAAVLLTHEDTMTPTTQSYLDGRDGVFVYAVGGPHVNAYADSDEADASVYGGDRFRTAVAVADEFFDAPVQVGIARSDVFADALTGGVHIGRIGGPMLVTPPASLQGDIEGYLCTNADSIGTAYVYGGVVAISQATADTVSDRVDGQGC